ncbi:MAG: hypothetical protein GX352_06710 [Clostridiales bacterium]|nr:hypothetical protein [Clostridiales bacterium]
MAKKVMDRRAADNKYLHRDFHVSGDLGIEYVGKRFGDNGVKEYLRRFATAFYSPLVEDIKERGLVALKEHIENIYEIEEAPEVLKTTLEEEELLVEVSQCPAIAYMKSIDYTPSKWYIEQTRTVNETIADNADLGFELISYDDETGKTAYRFFRRCF